MEGVQGQDQVVLGGNRPPQSRTARTRAAGQSKVPVRIGRELQAQSDDDGGDEGIQVPAGAPTTCPLPTCPDASVTRTRRALVSQLAAKHVVHGEPIPAGTLHSFGVRLCADPCRTLVSVLARCKNCRAAPSGPGTPPEEQVPVPMLPPPRRTPQGPGTPLTDPSPILVPPFQEVFAAQVPTVRHIPSMCRAAIADELVKLVSEVAVVTPT